MSGALSPEVAEELNRVLSEFMLPFGGFELALTLVHEMRGEFVVPVKPKRYPESMYLFFDALARAELTIRDRGIPVRLTPNIQQRLLVVVDSKETAERFNRPVAYLSTDGREWDDLAQHLGHREDKISGTMEGRAWDSESELESVVTEVIRAYPDVLPLGDLEAHWPKAA